MSHYEDLKWGGKLDACEICGKNVAVIGDARPVHAQCEAESVSPAPQREDHIIELPPMHEYKGEKIHRSPSPVAAPQVAYGTSHRTMCTAEAMRQNEAVAAPQEVKRWDLFVETNGAEIIDGGIVERENGTYVLHSDYVSLREELRKAIQERDNLNTCLVSCTKERNDAYFRLIETYKVPDPPSNSVVELSHMVEQVCTRAEKAESQVADMRKALKEITELEAGVFDFYCAQNIASKALALSEVKP